MFTGIITKTAKVRKVDKTDNGMVLNIDSPSGWEIETGDSIAVNGVCSTVKSVDDMVAFDYMPETLVKSNLGDLKVDTIVNLEQSLRASDRLDGHIVVGHVDTVGTIKSITPEGNSFIYKIDISQQKFMRLVAEKGSITIDGISLTVVDVGENFFTVKIIPYTLEHTNLQQKKVGDTVNLEFDILAKYLERLIKASNSNATN